MSCSFDYFVGELICPACGSISKSDESTNMQTKICKKPEMIPYGVGEKLELDKENIEGSGYILVNEPDGSDSFSIIDTWECQNCNAPYNWALIKIENAKILSIEAIELSENTIIASNYISEDCGYLGWDISEDGVKKIEI